MPATVKFAASSGARFFRPPLSIAVTAAIAGYRIHLLRARDSLYLCLSIVTAVIVRSFDHRLFSLFIVMIVVNARARDPA